MRIRALAVLALLATPMVAEAQMGRGGRRTPPTSLPPRAPGISSPQSFVPSNLSFETYSLFNFMTGGGYTGTPAGSNFNVEGIGSRLQWRMNPVFALTADLTSSMIGGPMAMSTGEIGGRFIVPGTDRAVTPYLDLRASYAYVRSSYGREEPGIGVMTPADQQLSRVRGNGGGLGAVAGLGFDFRLTRSNALVTGLNVTRHHLNGQMWQDGVPTAFSNRTDAVRFVLGWRYTSQIPVR